MEFEFDKEMDALLRQTARGEESAFAKENPPATHLDADEISAFAENVLPNKARIRVTKHLADCDSCRISLSNLIVLNSEAETPKTASTIVSTSKTEASAITLPWYQKLFGFQNLAYGLGALVILFAGFTAYIVFQNLNNSAVGDIARVDEKTENINGVPSQSNSASADSSDRTAETASEANSTAANSATEKNDSSDTAEKESQEPTILNEEQETPADDNIVADRRNNEIGLSKNKPRSVGTPNTGAYVDKPRQPKKSNKKSSDTAGADAGEDLRVRQTPGGRTENVPSGEKKKRDDSPITDRKGKIVADNIKEEDKPEAREKDADDSKASSSRQIGGKTFTQKNGVWVDTAYKNQKTTNVRRKTNEYRKLDSGLRSITDKLDGTVVVVWKTKAYKIQ